MTLNYNGMGIYKLDNEYNLHLVSKFSIDSNENTNGFILSKKSENKIWVT